MKATGNEIIVVREEGEHAINHTYCKQLKTRERDASSEKTNTQKMNRENNHHHLISKQTTSN